MSTAARVRDEWTRGADDLLEAVTGTLPVIRREGIQWMGGSGTLELRLTFENPSDRPTSPAPALVRFAEYGAFQPWRPLTTVAVPPVAPGGRTVVTQSVPDPRRSAPDGMGAVRRGVRGFLGGRGWTFLTALGMDPAVADAMEHPMVFAANIDVQVGSSRPVERHFGAFRCLSAGSTNFAMFKVGSVSEHTHRLRMTECRHDWQVAVTMGGASAFNDREKLEAGVTARFRSALAVVLVAPGDDATEGQVALEFSRPEVGDSTTVELELLSASGPGHSALMPPW